MKYLGPKTDPKDIATQSDVSAGGGGGGTTLPSGVIHMWATPTAPTGYLLCDGSTFDSATYPALATALGDTYGVHSGTTYYLPDFRDRMPLGAGPSHALGGSEGAANGSRGGGWDHVHSHSVPGHEHWAPGVDHIHGLNSHTHTPGSLSIATVADRAGGTGNRGGNPISGVTGGPNANSNAADRSLASWTNSNQLSGTNNNTAYTHPWQGVNFIIKT